MRRYGYVLAMHFENYERDNDDDSEIFMKCRESPCGKRRERIAYGRVELHDVDNDITRISLANVLSCSCPVKSLIVGRRDPKRIRCGLTFCSSRLKMLAGIGKILVEFVFFSFRHCLSACSNKSLRVTVQRPQVSANTSSTVVCFVCRASTYYMGTPITSD